LPELLKNLIVATAIKAFDEQAAGRFQVLASEFDSQIDNILDPGRIGRGNAGEVWRHV
jgi:hypothetical protein